MSGAANGRPVLGMADIVNKHASLFARIGTAEEKKDLEYWHHFATYMFFQASLTFEGDVHPTKEKECCPTH